MYHSEPRYASLPNIMKAKKKPIEKMSPADIGIDFAPRLETLKVTEPPKRVGGGKVGFCHSRSFWAHTVPRHRWPMSTSFWRSSKKLESLANRHKHVICLTRDLNIRRM